MSLFDIAKSALGSMISQVETQALPGLLAQVLGSTQAGGLQNIIGQLSQAGLGEQVSSWLGKGQNLPITPEQITAVLSEEHVQALATSLGIPTDRVIAFVAEHLPAAVDQASPDGTLQTA